MKKLIASASIVPDKRRVKDDGSFPLKLRITFKGKREYYATGHDATMEDWEAIRKNEARGALKKIALTLSEIQINAQKCCDTIREFSFSKFESAFFPKAPAEKTLKSAFEKYVTDLRLNEQVGTASSCECACISLHKFKPRLKLEDITPEFLRSYEHWFIKEGKSITTVGIYLRALRSVINAAIADGDMPAEGYPFGKRKYIIPSGKNIKKALTLGDIAKIYNYPAQAGSIEERCRDYWIFNYLCNGINVKDLCLLKYQNIKGDFIVLQRAKTIRTRREKPEPITISLKDDAKQIIAKWGQKPANADKYVFPCLTPGMTPDEIRNQAKSTTRLINDHIKVIAVDLGLKKKVTTSYSRHSFATILKNSGVPTEFVSEALGHSSLTTTKNYLAGFEQDDIKKTTDILISFKKEMQKAV
jgi:integrase